jgi:2-methylcitrate dehydratase PrpD
MPRSDLTLTQCLADRLQRPVSPRDRARARLHLLDWAGCVCGAWQTPVGQIARTGEHDAVTCYALLGNVLEMDDVHRAAILHPGPVVLSAALSAARETRASLGSLLDAAVRGYDAMITLGASLDAHHYALFHPTSTAGGFGAVAAAGSIYGLSAEQYVWGFGNAGSLAGGLWQMRHDPLAMTKQLHVAHAAHTGVWIARLAAHQFRGPADILEGSQGFYAAFTNMPKPDVFRQDQDWHIHTVSFKPWAACRHAHPAIDAALALKEKMSLNDVDIHVETYRDALGFCDRPNPQTELEAKFSLQHAVAVVAVRGVPKIEDFGLASIFDPQLMHTRKRIHVHESASYTARYPAHFGATVRAADMAVSLTDTRGDPERPMDINDMHTKAQQLMIYGERLNGDALIDWITAAPESAPVSELLDLMP